VANAALAVIVLWGGFNVIVREHLGTPYHAAMELFPRLALGAVAVNTSLWWSAALIELNNELCAVVGLSNPFPVWDDLTHLDRAAVEGLAVLVYLVFGVLLFLQQLGRLALVDLLIVTAPLGLLCWVLPQTYGWAQLWSSTFARVVFTQFAQATVLKVGASLLGAWTAALDWPLTDVLSIFLGIAVLGLTFTLPGLLRAHVGDGLGFVRYFVYQSAARGLNTTLGTVAGRAAVAAGVTAPRWPAAAGAGRSAAADRAHGGWPPRSAPGWLYR
jgi:hypothetical protein